MKYFVWSSVSGAAGCPLSALSGRTGIVVNAPSFDEYFSFKQRIDDFPIAKGKKRIAQ